MLMSTFTWDDVPALVELINLVTEAESGDRIVSLSSLKEELSQPELSAEENCFLFTDDRGLQAYCLIIPELRIGRTVLELGIHPGHRETGIENEVLATSVARAKELGAQVLHVCLPPSRFWEELMERDGFTLVRRYWLMDWLDESVPTVDLQPGLAIESFRPGDEERLTQIQNATFEGSWGFSPNTVEQIAYRAAMPSDRPPVVLFMTSGGDTAGYCWTLICGPPEKPVGIIGMIGIQPAYRGRGLSTPILLAGMHSLRERGAGHIRLNVDKENVAATKLYLSAGYEMVQELHWFESSVSAG